MSEPQKLLDRLDAALYRFERRATGFLMLLMAAAVFADVVHRVFARRPGRISTMVNGLLGVPIETMESVGAPLVIGLSLFLMAYGALQARARSKGAAMPGSRAALYALGFVLASSASVQAFISLVPQGIVGAPYFALCVFLWIGLIGASMATYAQRHLALEMGEKLWPEAARPHVKNVARLITAGFTTLVVVLGTMSLVEHLNVWLDSPTANLIPSIDVPKWAVFWIIPYTFGVMTLRLVGCVLGLLSLHEPGSEIDLAMPATEEPRS